MTQDREEFYLNKIGSLKAENMLLVKHNTDLIEYKNGLEDRIIKLLGEVKELQVQLNNKLKGLNDYQKGEIKEYRKDKHVQGLENKIHELSKKNKQMNKTISDLVSKMNSKTSTPISTFVRDGY